MGSPDDRARLSSRPLFNSAGRYISEDDAREQAMYDRLGPETYWALLEAEGRQADRGLAAMRLAPDLQTYRALMADEPVPRHRLDQRYAHLLEKWPTSSTASQPTT
jgi:hypothetical protein